MFLEYVRAKEAARVESFRAENDIVHFNKDFDAPSADYIASTDNIPSMDIGSSSDCHTIQGKSVMPSSF